MSNKKEHHSREASRRGSRSVHDYDEEMSRHKPKVSNSQDGRGGQDPLPRHRSMAIRPHDRDRDLPYYEGHSSHASNLMTSEEAQKSIHALFKQVKDTTSFFARFRDGYQQDVCGIEVYAGQTILEKLWERKIRSSDGKNRASKGRSEDDCADVLSAFDDVSSRLCESLNHAFDGARSHPSSQNDSLARKLEVAIKDFGRLLNRVHTNFQEMDSLIKELKLLKVVLELGGAGKASNDDRAKQRHKSRASGHEHLEDRGQESEDARYEANEEGSGSEDDDEQGREHSGHSRGREEAEADGDEEGQGLFSIYQSVYSITNA